MNQNPKQIRSSFVPMPVRRPEAGGGGRPMPAPVISDVAPPQQHKQYNPQLAPQNQSERPSVPQSRHIPVAVASVTPVVTAKPVSAQPVASAEGVTIRLTIPNPRNVKLPEFVREYKAFWWILAIFGLLLFTVGYVIGHHVHAAPASLPAAFFGVHLGGYRG